MVSIANIRQDKAPFNVSTERFARVGFHPSLDPSGCMTKKNPKLGPGSYDPKYTECVGKSKQNEVWKRKLESEIWSKNLGYHLPEILVDRKFRASIGGPAMYTVYDTNPNLYKKTDSLRRKNRGFGYDQRFRKLKCEDNNPPPDTYFRRIGLLSTIKRLGFSETPTFDWAPKDRFKDEVPSFHQGPARYKVKDHDSFAARANKSTSRRRPLEFFTCPRDYSSIKNHFAQRSFPEVDQLMTLEGSIDYLLNNRTKKRYGKFMKTQRWLLKPVVREIMEDLSLCYRDPMFPDPTTYNMENYKSIKHAPVSKYPFGQSTVNPRPKVDWKLQPGVGRFHPQEATCKYKSKKASWPFLSKVERGQAPKKEYSYL